MRSKESAHDYRYFPDTDLPPLRLDPSWVMEVAADLPELGDRRRSRFVRDYRLPWYDADLLTARRDVAEYFEAAAALHSNPKGISNWIIGDLFRVLKERQLDSQLIIENWPLQPAQLAELVSLVDSGKISGKIAKSVFEALLDTPGSPQEIVATQGLEQVSDSASLEQTVVQVLAANAKQASEYRSGNQKIFGFLVGQVMKATSGRANPKVVNEILTRKLTAE
jgi:aspartyl-tRNA(Asn)/glutamyl-tRNA(Gln) amidotransferase subunit B